jgi:hypothetical protein
VQYYANRPVSTTMSSLCFAPDLCLLIAAIIASFLAVFASSEFASAAPITARSQGCPREPIALFTQSAKGKARRLAAARVRRVGSRGLHHAQRHAVGAVEGAQGDSARAQRRVVAGIALAQAVVAARPDLEKHEHQCTTTQQ